MPIAPAALAALAGGGPVGPAACVSREIVYPAQSKLRLRRVTPLPAAPRIEFCAFLSPCVRLATFECAELRIKPSVTASRDARVRIRVTPGLRRVQMGAAGKGRYP